MNESGVLCEWLHRSLVTLPVFSYPFDKAALPKNGIYFFYEKGERCGHKSGEPRIVRVGTHRDGNFRSRIAEHFLLNERKMAFTADEPAPHDRSIFRKNIGRALLNKAGDPYLSVWNIDFTPQKTRETKGHLRDISTEIAIETEVTQIIRQDFWFRSVEIPEQTQRMGSEGLERALIGTLARCPQCGPSDDWLGRYSPEPRIRESGLWLVQGLRAAPLSLVQKDMMAAAIERSVARS